MSAIYFNGMAIPSSKMKDKPSSNAIFRNQEKSLGDFMKRIGCIAVLLIIDHLFLHIGNFPPFILLVTELGFETYHLGMACWMVLLVNR